MKSKYSEFDLSKIKTVDFKETERKISVKDFGKPLDKKAGFGNFLESLPKVLGTKDFFSIVNRILSARKLKKPIIFAMGAHVIKTGITPYLLKLIGEGFVSAIALNGAGIIHDCELAMKGCTSENVDETLMAGKFGMTAETVDFIASAINFGFENRLGYGEAVGKKILISSLKFGEYSLLAEAYKNNIPVTAHTAIGTEIIYQHPGLDGAKIGELSTRDFRIFCNQLKLLPEGGVYLNIGSAVILPEVFLKALSVVINAGTEMKNFTTVNIDMIRSYRTEVNILKRPTINGGRSFNLIGQHELLLPLLFQALLEFDDSNIK